jgi:hypothetical protein
LLPVFWFVLAARPSVEALSGLDPAKAQVRGSGFLLPGVRETKISRFPQLGFSPRGKKSVHRFLSAKAAEMRCCSEFQKWRSAWRGVILE